MSKESEDELGPEERRALGSLAAERRPPALLEERVVKTLKELNLIRPPGADRQLGLAKVAAAFAASLLLFTLGLAVGAWRTSAPTRGAAAPEFLLILRAAPQTLQARSADEVLQRVREYEAWSGKVRQAGLTIEGEKLRQETRVLRVIDGRPALSESRSEPAESAVAGFFLIHARDYEHAVTIAEGCPHLKYGGSIEIRQIEHL